MGRRNHKSDKIIGFFNLKRLERLETLVSCGLWVGMWASGWTRLGHPLHPHLGRRARAGPPQTDEHLGNEKYCLRSGPPTAEQWTFVGRGDGPAAVWAHVLREGSQLASRRLGEWEENHLYVPAAPQPLSCRVRGSAWLTFGKFRRLAAH